MMKSSKTVIVLLLIIFWNATVLSTVKATAESVEYEHDSNGRLIRAHHGNSGHIRYEYDANGNRLRSKMIKDAVTLPKNLVINHQFQQSAQNGEALYWKKEIWGAAESDFALVDRQTNRMQKISGSKIAKNGMVAVSQTFEVAGSKEFKTSAIFQVDRLQHATVQLYVDFLNKDDVFVGANITEWDKRTDGGYITLANHGQVPANAKKAIIYAILRGIEDDGAGTILVDSLRFSYETDKNLLSNPYFGPGINLDIAEDWNKTVWSSGSSHFATARYGLNKVQKITASQMKSNEMTAISQTIKVEKQKDYTVSGLFKIDHLQGSKVQLYIDFMSGAGQFIGANVTEYEQSTNGHFIVLSNSGKVPDNAEKAIVYAIIRGIADQSSGTIYVDSLNFQYSDERNLLSNPEFRIYPDQDEIGDGWNKEIWTADGSDFQVKLVNHHQVQKIAGSGIQKNGTVAISQHLKVNELQSFEVGGSLHVHQLEHSKIQLYIDFFDANNQFIGANITEQLHPTPDYVTLHNEGQIPKHAVRALVYVIIRGVDDHASGAVDVDKLMFRYK